MYPSQAPSMSHKFGRIVIFFVCCGVSLANEYCIYRWTKYEGQNAPGQQQQGSSNTYTEQSCKDACIQNTACRNIDYNNRDRTCWFGFTVNPFRTTNLAVNHYALVHECIACSGGNPYTWIPQSGRNVPGLIRQVQFNSYTEDTCKNACLEKAECCSVDWNDRDKTCWHGTEQNPTLTIYSVVTHWDLVRNWKTCTTGGPTPTSSAPTTEFCTYKWTKYPNQHVSGLQLKGYAYTEQSCMDSCIQSSVCQCIDFNNQDRTCWFGYTANPARASRTFVDHYVLTRDCATTTLKTETTTAKPVSVCIDVSPYTWTAKSGRNAPGLTQQGGANSFTEDSCKSACLAKGDCWSVDWNDRDKSCWHGNKANPTLTNYSVVTHWDLVRNNDSCRLTVVTIGDWGDYPSNVAQNRLAQVMSDWCGKKGDCAFVVSTGDTFYENGVSSTQDPRFNTSWRWVYDKPNINNLTWYLTLGNHDYGFGEPGDRELYQISYSKFEPRWVLPWLWYDFVIQKDDYSVHYIMVDAQSIEIRKYDWEKQLAWYNKTLTESKADWKVVVTHYPPYTFGKYIPGSAIHRQTLVPAAEKYGVDFFITGHDHNVQHISKSVKPDIDYIISAGGGKELYDFVRTQNSTLVNMGFQSKYFGFQWGFVVQEFKKQEALTEFIDINGKVIYSFVRTKPQKTF